MNSKYKSLWKILYFINPIIIVLFIFIIFKYFIPEIENGNIIYLFFIIWAGIIFSLNIISFIRYNLLKTKVPFPKEKLIDNEYIIIDSEIHEVCVKSSILFSIFKKHITITNKRIIFIDNYFGFLTYKLDSSSVWFDQTTDNHLENMSVLEDNSGIEYKYKNQNINIFIENPNQILSDISSQGV